MSIGSDRLEDMLYTFEDLCRLQEALSLGSQHSAKSDQIPLNPPVEGGLARWRTLRHLLLQGGVEKIPHEEWKFPPMPDGGALYQYVRRAAAFPEELFAWTRSSRRIFAVDANLQKMLLAGDYSKLLWDKILFPFSNFMIELEEPIMLTLRGNGEARSDCSCDAFMVSWWKTLPGDGPGDMLSIRFFHKRANAHPGVIRQSQRNELQKEFEKKRWVPLAIRAAKLLKETKGADGDVQGRHVMNVYTKDDGPQVRIEIEDMFARAVHDAIDTQTQDLSGLVLEDYEPYSLAAKIAVGLCLYLQHMSGAALSEDKSPPKGRRPGPAQRHHRPVARVSGGGARCV